MKVSLVTSFEFPGGKATANRVAVLAEELIKNEKVDQVEVFCVSNSNSGTYLFKDSIRINSIKVKNIDKTKYFTRALHEFFLALRLCIKAQKLKCEINIVTIPSILLLVPVIFFSRRNFYVLDIRDAVWTYFGGNFYSKLIGKIIAALIKCASRRVAIISVTNKAECEKVKEISGLTSLIVPNGISQAKLEEFGAIPAVSPSDKFRISYIGNVGIAQELDKLIEFSIRIPNLKIQIIGDGAKLDILRWQYDCDKYDNVSFVGFVAPTEVRKYIENSDVLFAQIGSAYKTAVPTKVFEYIASGRKVLLGLPDGEAREVFSKFHGVEIFDVGIFESFKTSLMRLKKLDYCACLVEKDIELLKEQHMREVGAKLFVENILELFHCKNKA